MHQRIVIECKQNQFANRLRHYIGEQGVSVRYKLYAKNGVNQIRR